MHLHRPIVKARQDRAEVIGGLWGQGAGAHLGGDVLGDFGGGDLLEIGGGDRWDRVAGRALLPLLADLAILDGQSRADRAEGFAEIVDISLHTPFPLHRPQIFDGGGQHLADGGAGRQGDILPFQLRRFDLPHLLLGDLQGCGVQADPLLLAADIVDCVIGFVPTNETSHARTSMRGLRQAPNCLVYKMVYRRQTKRDLLSASPCIYW